MTAGQAYEEDNKDTESKYNGIKENAQLVDDIRADIRDLENKKRSTKTNISMTHKSVGELENLLKSTFDPLSTYVMETQKVASRVKTATQRKEGLFNLKEQINNAVLEIFDENTKLETELGNMKKETEALKKAAREKMNAGKSSA